MFYSLTGVHTSDYRSFTNSITNGVAAIQFPNTKTAAGSNGVGAAGSANFGTANQIDLRDPYATQWSFTVERGTWARKQVCG